MRYLPGFTSGALLLFFTLYIHPHPWPGRHAAKGGADLMTEVVYRPTGLVSDKPMTARMAGVKISALPRTAAPLLFPHRDNLQTRRECSFLRGGDLFVFGHFALYSTGPQILVRD